MLIDLWYVLTDEAADPALQDRYRRMLPEDELAEERRFRFEAGRRQALVARVLARMALSARADVNPSAWQFSRNRFGKPSVASPTGTGLEFNITHTHGLVACAVGQGAAVGVDAEDLYRTNSGMDIARRFFAPAEVAALEATPESDRHNLFYSFWTLKEAFIKGRGLGMSLPLDEFAFGISAAAVARVNFVASDLEHPDGWQFARFRLGPRYVLATAVRQPPSEPVSIAVRNCLPLVRLGEPRLFSGDSVGEAII